MPPLHRLTLRVRSSSSSTTPSPIPTCSFSTSPPRPATPLWMLAKLSHQRETQHFSKLSGLGVTNHVPTLEAIKSSEVDPFFGSGGVDPSVGSRGKQAKGAGKSKATPVSLVDFHLLPLGARPKSQRIAAGAVQQQPPPASSVPPPPSSSASGVADGAPQPRPGPREQLIRARLATSLALFAKDDTILRDSSAPLLPTIRMQLIAAYQEGHATLLDQYLSPAVRKQLARAAAEDEQESVARRDGEQAGDSGGAVGWVLFALASATIGFVLGNTDFLRDGGDIWPVKSVSDHGIESAALKRDVGSSEVAVDQEALRALIEATSERPSVKAEEAVTSLPVLAERADDGEAEVLPPTPRRRGTGSWFGSFLWRE